MGLLSRLTGRPADADGGDWLDDPGWDPEAFERRVRRTRPSERAHCLRRKAAALLESGDRALEEPAAGLLERLLTHHADDEQECAAAHGLLAGLYERRADLPVAIDHAEQALALQPEGTPALAHRQLQLAGLLAAARVECRAGEAARLLDAVLTTGLEGGPLQRFTYLTARARLAVPGGQADRGSAYARAALRLLTDQQPSPLADLGPARRDAGTLSDLQRLADAGNADALVAGMDVPRSPDGSVRWTWAVIRRLDEQADARPAYGAFQDAAAPLLASLEQNGFAYDDLGALQQARLADADAQRLAPILVHWLGRIEHPGVRAAIVYPLADPRVRGLAAPALLNLYRGLRPRTPDDAVLEEALVAALATLLAPEHFDDLVELLRDPARGGLQSPLLAVLPSLGHPAESEKLALAALEEDEDSTVAIRVLGELRSRQARPAIERIARRDPPRAGGEQAQAERARIRVARQALARIDGS